MVVFWPAVLSFYQLGASPYIASDLTHSSSVKYVVLLSLCLLFYARILTYGSLMKDFLDLDDEIRSSKAASTLPAEGTKKVETSVVESKALSSEAVTVDETSLVPDSKQHANTELGKTTELEASDGTVIGDKKTGFTFPMALPSSTTFQLVSKSTSAFDQIVPPKEPNAPAPLFSFGPKRVGEIPSPFPYSSSISDSAVLKSSAPLEPRPESATRSVSVGEI